MLWWKNDEDWFGGGKKLASLIAYILIKKTEMGALRLWLSKCSAVKFIIRHFTVIGQFQYK